MNKTLLPIALLLGLSLIPISQTGCISAERLDPAGVYAGDAVLANADQQILHAYDVMHTFVRWEFNNRALLLNRPEIRKAADAVRVHGRRAIESAVHVRDAYAAAPNPANRSKLESALAILDAALAEASKYVSQ